MTFVDIDTRHFARELERARKRFRAVSPVVEKSAASALNKTAERIKTSVKRELSRAIGLPQKEIAKKISAYKSSAKHLVARVWIGLKRGIALSTVQGATYMLRGKHAGSLKAGKTYTKVFRATMKSGHRGLFVRVLPSVRASAGRAQTSPNLPIEEPTIRLQPQAEQILRSVANTEAREFLPREFARVLQYRLRALSRTTRK